MNHGAAQYTIIENRVLDDMRLSDYGLLAYLALRRHVGPDEMCCPTYVELARYMRCSLRMVQYALKELKRLGYLTAESEQADGRVNTYHLHAQRTSDAGGL